LLQCMSPKVALTDDYAMSALTVAIWGKPDQICSTRDFLGMTHSGHWVDLRNGIYGTWRARSSLLRLDVRGPDHFAPLLSILDDVIAELGG
jgi:hypothetical protein